MKNFSHGIYDPKQHQLRFKKLLPEATIPSYQKEGDSGMDISAALPPDAPMYPDDKGGFCQMIIIFPMSQELIPTGLACGIPLGYELQLRPRSGLSLKHHISITNSPSTIDSGFRGPIGVILRNNHPTKSFFVKTGDRICQAVLAETPKLDIVEVEELEETERGSGGFGSTKGWTETVNK